MMMNNKVKDQIKVVSFTNSMKDIRNQIHSMESRGMYFGRCINKEVVGEALVLTFKCENQNMTSSQYSDEIVRGNVIYNNIENL